MSGCGGRAACEHKHGFQTQPSRRAEGAEHGDVWKRERLAGRAGTASPDWATERTRPKADTMREKIDRVYERYYRGPLEHANCSRSAEWAAFECGVEGAAGQQPAPTATSLPATSVTIGGENFGLLRTMSGAVSSRMQSLFGFNQTKVSPDDSDDDDDRYRGGLPIWVIARLKVKLERARHAIIARNEKTRKKHAIKPDGRRKIIWDLITTLMLVYTLFEIPLELAFIETSCNLDALAAMNLVVDIVFCVDIAVAFHTGFYVKMKGQDILEDNHWQIAERYIRGWFFVDLISSIPLERFVCLALPQAEPGDVEGESGIANQLRGFKVARFLKLTRLLRFNKMLNKWQAMSAKKWQLNATRLLKLILMLLMSAHFMGCTWMFTMTEQDCGVWAGEMTSNTKGYGCSCKPSIDGYDDCEPMNWLAKYDGEMFRYGTIVDKYVASSYFTIIGLSTVGFGDITPANTVERAISILFTLLGALLFAIVIGSVSDIAQQGNHFEEDLSGTVHMISDFLEHRNVSEESAKRIIAHTTYASQKAPQHFTPDQLNFLPRTIRKDVMKHLVGEQLGTVMFSYPIFMNMDQELRNELLLHLRPWMLLDQECLFDALDVGREAYILTSGTFEVYRYENQFGHMAKDEDMITTVGELIGVIGLMDDGPPYRLTTVISYGRSEVLELTKEAFDHCCKLNYPDVYQSVQDMATSELTAPANKDAFIAMRSRSMRRCSYLKQKVRKDPLTGVVGDASSRETDKNGTQGPLKQGSMLNMNKDVASIVGEGGADSQSLDKRMDKLEAAVQGLTSMVAKMSEKLDNMGGDQTSLPSFFP